MLCHSLKESTCGNSMIGAHTTTDPHTHLTLARSLTREEMSEEGAKEVDEAKDRILYRITLVLPCRQL